MSRIDSILGLSGLDILRVDPASHQVQVWAKPKRRPACLYCHSAHVRIKATHTRTLKHTRQGNRLLLVHLTVPKYHCQSCNRYFRHRFAGIRPRLRATESYRLEVFEAHNGGVSQSQLSQTHQIGSATVERWYQHFIKRRVSEMSSRPCPSVLGIDEHFFSKKKGYATTLVDLKNHKVFDVVLGRSEPSLQAFLTRLKGREKVEYVVMDLSETYRSIVQKYFPNAKIIADRFHVIRLVNHHFLKLWQQHDAVGRKNRGLLSLMRRHEWKLAPEQRINLYQYLAQYPVLKAIYHAKQRLNSLLLIKTIRAKHARKMIPKLLELLNQFEDSPARALANTLKSWIDPVMRMWRFSYSNGITEGFHTKMEMMSRRAYGFKNFNNYRLRVLAHCGWNGIINRV